MGTRTSEPLATGGMISLAKLQLDRRTDGSRGRLVRRLFVVSVFLLVCGQAASAQSLEQLSDALRNGDLEQKRSALFEIRNRRTPEASRLAVPALGDPSPIVRAEAAASVRFLPEQERVAVLVPLLSDREPFVRKESAYALGSVRSPKAGPPLLGVLSRDKDLEIRAAAAVALGYSGDRGAIGSLVAVLKERPTESHEFLRRSAARSIGQIAQLVNSGGTYSVTPQNFLPDKYKSVKGDGLSAASPVFSAAVKVLTEVAKNKNEAADTRREAAYSLGAIGNVSAIDTLESLSASPDPYMATIAKEALLTIRTYQSR